MALFSTTGYGAVQESNTVAQRWQLFHQQLQTLNAEPVVTQATLNQYPTSLLLPSSQFPALDQVSWSQLTSLYQIKKQCELGNNLKSSDQFQSSMMTLAAEFELALCSGSTLPDAWFQTEQWQHPAGDSYADRYLAYLIKKHGAQSNELSSFLHLHHTLLTLNNSYHPLFKPLASLPDEGRQTILSSYITYITPDNQLWVHLPKGIYHFKANMWLPLASQFELAINPITPDQFCPITDGNLCIQNRAASQLGMWVLFITLSVISLISLTRLIIERRRANQEKRFILQLLTHELRTPITSLGLTVEQFREQFDSFNEPTQAAFGRLLADHTRLRKLTETSKSYLSKNKHNFLYSQTAYVSDWLNSCVEQYDLDYTIDKDQELTLPYYWLGLCLDNLIRNALSHGAEPILIKVTITRSLYIEVRDSGKTTNMWSALAQRTSSNSSGMGIGLTLIKRIMTKLGGRLTHQKQPTRYTLELPL